MKKEQKDINQSSQEEAELNPQKSSQPQKSPNELSPKTIEDTCKRAGFIINQAQAKNLYEYLYILQKWNQSMNLVGKNTWQDILQDLIMDSLHLTRFLLEKSPLSQNAMTHSKKNTNNLFTMPQAEHTRKDAQIWDLGAGAGLPGIPLRIFWTCGEYHLVESREKRCIFLSTALAKLTIPYTHVYRGRAEKFMENKKADLIISRAFMPYNKMLPYVAPHIKQHSEKGQIIFLTHEKLDASEYNNNEYSFETDNIYEYIIKRQKRYLCAVSCRSHLH